MKPTNKAIRERILRIERLRGSAEFVFAIRDPSLYDGVKVKGYVMSETHFKQFAEALPAYTELYVVSILENKIEGPFNE